MRQARKIGGVILVSVIFLSGTVLWVAKDRIWVLRKYDQDGFLIIEKEVILWGIPHGRFETFDRDGRLLSNGEFRHGKMHGFWNTWKSGSPDLDVQMILIEGRQLAIKSLPPWWTEAEAQRIMDEGREGSSGR